MNSYRTPIAGRAPRLILATLTLAAAAAGALGQTGRLFWTETTTGAVRTADTNGAGLSTLATGMRALLPLDADSNTRQVFFAETGTGDIARMNFDGTGRTTILPGIGSSCLGLAVDPVGQKLWWSDWNTGDIMNANYDGTGAQTVFTIHGGIGGLDIDPVNGKIYIAATRTILQADLNGNNLTTFFSTQTGDLLDVAVDPTTKGVFWTDNRHNKVQRADLSGANVKDVLTTGLSTPIGIDVLPSLGELYVANKGSGNVVSATLSGQNAQVVYSNSGSQTWGLAAVVPAPGTAIVLIPGLAMAGRRRR